MPDFSIVIPCYNESENLEKLLKTIKKVPQKYEVEFILVENGSTDSSNEFFKSSKLFDGKRIKKVFVKNNQGYGYGITQGIKAASGKYVGWLHADMQYDPRDLAPFFDYIMAHPDDKLLMKGRRKNRKLIEHFFTFGMGVYDTILFKKKMFDVMSMPIIFNRELLKGRAKLPKDFTIDIYIYALALNAGYSVVHLPIYLKERGGGKSSWNDGLISRFKMSARMIRGSVDVKKRLK